MFFAILDRRVAWSLVNACFSVAEEAGTSSEEPVHYYFSVNADALEGRRGFRNGVVYVLPRSTFEREAPDDSRDVVITSRQWASLRPVRPLASIAVTPDDFPFIDDVNGHDYAAVAARAAKDPDAFPWR